MKHILLTTALVAFATVPAFAQTAAPAEGQTAPAPAEMAATGGGMTDGNVYITQSGEATVFGSEFIGKSVYVTESSGWGTSIDAVPADWDNIAKVQDILMTADGEIRGVLVDVGGFLGLGARSVALDMKALDIVYDRTADDFYVVFTSNREALEGAPAYDQAADTAGRRDRWDMPRNTGTAGQAASGGLSDVQPGDPAPQGGLSDNQPPVVADNGQTGAASTPMAADGNGVTIAPMDGYADADRAVLTAEDVQDANVYDANNADIASVSEVLLTADGQIDRVIIDVGGFLGMGAKPVAIPFADLTLWQNADQNDLRIYLPMTREQMEALPTHES
ncbi:PRC-barrel domain-containing protein [Paracoccaceae bacterium Fryx2]|nr:PRC-barrel domain-containing protein [Paracoccaceae bacterium Fryx2]